MKKNFKRLISKFLVMSMLLTSISVGTIGGVVNAMGANMLVNGDFEAFASGKFTNWVTSETFTQSQVTGRNGYAASLAGRNKTWAGIQQLVDTPTPKYNLYNVNVWVKLGATLSNGGNPEKASISVECKNSSNANLSPQINFSSPVTEINNSTWTQLSLYVYMDPAKTNIDEVAKIKVYVSTVGTSDIILDDFQVIPFQSANNIVVNGGFEAPNIANSNGWDGFETTTTFVTTDKHSDNYSALVTNRKQNYRTPYYTVRKGITNGQTYRYSAWVKLVNATDSDRACVVLQGRKTADGGGSNENYYQTSYVTLSSSEWTHISGTRKFTDTTVPINAMKIVVNTEKAAVSGGYATDIYLDDIELEIIPDATPSPSPTATPAPTPNLLVNGSFETYTSGSFSSWSIVQATTPPTVTQVAGRTGMAISVTGRDCDYAGPHQTIDFAGSDVRNNIFEASAYVKAGAGLTGKKAIINFEGRTSTGAKTTPNILYQATADITDSDWTLVKLTLDASQISEAQAAQMSKIKVNIGTVGTEYFDILIDDFVLKTVNDANPIQNPGFEDGTLNGWGTYGTTGPTPQNWSLVSSATEAHSGSYAVKSVSATNAGSQLNQVGIIVTPGKWYEFSFYAKIAAFSNVKVRNNTDGAMVSGSQELNLAYNSGWTKYIIEFRAPAEGKVKLYLNEGGTGTNYYDDFNIRKIADKPALDRKVFSLKVGGDEFTGANVITKTGALTASYTLTNNTTSTVNIIAVCGIYNGSELASVVTQPVSIGSFLTTSVDTDITIPNNVKNGTFKLMYLDSLLNLVPLNTAYPINVTVSSTLRLPNIFSDNMVLQRGEPIKIFGEAPDGATITITFAGKETIGTAVGGRFELEIPAESASFTGQSLTVTAQKDTYTGTKTYTNVVIGDVFYGSGQSNMQLYLSGCNKVPTTVIDNFRLFTVTTDKEVSTRINSPQTLTGEGWRVGTTGSSISNASAVMYFMAKALRDNGVIDAPIGVINCSYGGTSIEDWWRYEVFKTDTQFAETLGRYKTGQTYGSQSMRPTQLYYAMARYIIPYNIKGMVWYQGENDISKAYDKMLKTFIDDYRVVWGKPNLPVFVVQLPGYGGTLGWDEFRLKQQQAISDSGANSYLIITNDTGSSTDIHPWDKDVVGDRIGRMVANKVYGVQIPYVGPVFKSKTISGSVVTLDFDNTSATSPLEAANGTIGGFEIAGADNVYYAATATIIESGLKLELTSASVSAPTKVRYGYVNTPLTNGLVTNTAGVKLPLAPFRN